MPTPTPAPKKKPNSNLHPVVRHLMDTDFADLAGSYFNGNIALTDELINMGLAELLAGFNTPKEPKKPEVVAPADPPEDEMSMPDPKALISKVNVSHLQYRTEKGKTILEVKANI